eukprot:83193_1
MHQQTQSRCYWQLKEFRESKIKEHVAQIRRDKYKKKKNKKNKKNMKKKAVDPMTAPRPQPLNPDDFDMQSNQDHIAVNKDDDKNVIDLSEFMDAGADGANVGDVDGANVGDVNGANVGDVDGANVGDVDGANVGDVNGANVGDVDDGDDVDDGGDDDDDGDVGDVDVGDVDVGDNTHDNEAKTYKLCAFAPGAEGPDWYGFQDWREETKDPLSYNEDNDNDNNDNDNNDNDN